MVTWILIVIFALLIWATNGDYEKAKLINPRAAQTAQTHGIFFGLLLYACGSALYQVSTW